LLSSWGRSNQRDALPFGWLWYGDTNAVANAVGYAKHCSRSHDAVIHVYDDAGSMIETHEQAGDFKEMVKVFIAPVPSS
jgi:hypothetical protein